MIGVWQKAEGREGRVWQRVEGREGWRVGGRERRWGGGVRWGVGLRERKKEGGSGGEGGAV